MEYTIAPEVRKMKNKNENIVLMDRRGQKEPLKYLDCTYAAHRPTFYQICPIFRSQNEQTILTLHQ